MDDDHNAHNTSISDISQVLSPSDTLSESHLEAHNSVHSMDAARQVANEDDMPPLVPATLEQTNTRLRHGTNDDDMTDDLPDLQSVSDSSEDKDDDEADDFDVEMDIATASDSDMDMPHLESIPPQPPTNPIPQPVVEDEDASSHTVPGVSTSDPPTPIIGPADSARPDSRPVRPLPRNGPPPLRPHQHNPLFAALGGGLGPQLPFDFPTLFGHVLGEAGPQNPPNAQPETRTDARPSTPLNHAIHPNDNPPAPEPRTEPPHSNRTATPTPVSANGEAPRPNRGRRGPAGGFADITMGWFRTTPQGVSFEGPPGNQDTPEGITGNQPREGNGMGGMPSGVENFLRNILSGDFTPLFTGQMENEREDPERAKRLIAGLEVVPHALVRRLERVGGVADTHSENDLSGGEAGCAICWDKLLDSAGFGSKTPEKTEDSVTDTDAGTAAQSGEDAEDPPLADLPTEEASNPEEDPKIVALPCAHVFHASCLMPWFSRPGQTTCPTCRFNIDPENLTYRYRAAPRPNPRRRSRNAAEAGGDNADHPAQPAPADRTARQTQAAVDVSGSTTPQATPQPAAIQPTPGDGPTGNTNERRRSGTRSAPGEWRAFNFGYDRTPTDVGPDAQFFTVNFDVIFNPLNDNAQGQANPQQQPGQAQAQDGPRNHGHHHGRDHVHAHEHPANMFGIGDFMQMFADPLARATMGGGFPGEDPQGPTRGQAPLRPKKKWIPPPPPGLTLRQRVEKKEREAGLRCSDVSCGYGPTDDDPVPEAPPSSKQVCIRPAPGSLSISSRVCEHSFHPACLVSAERVAGWGEREEPEGQPLRVACPVCRAVGSIDRNDWDEGVQASS